jgi:hypothetical protein
MARFTLTAQVDHFFSVPNENNDFYFTPGTLQAADTITGLAAGSFIDTAIVTETGTITAAQFAGLTNLDALILAAAGNDVALSDSLVANSSRGYFTVTERVSVALPWRDDDGTLYVWQVNDGQVHATTTYSAELLTPVVWHIESTADLNGDGQGDILWRHDDGTVGVWLMNGGEAQQRVTFDRALTPLDWHIAGVADFNGDREADILWRNDDGTVGIWFMDGVAQQSTATFDAAWTPLSWQVAGTADFNADGKADILWRNTDGSVGIWFMDGDQRQATVAFSSDLASPSWHIAGTADFNGDGKADILWRDDSGAVGIWFMDGGNRQSHAFDASLSPSFWHILGTADFNGDGKSDIIWQSDTGEFGIWLIDGDQILGTQAYHPAKGLHFVEAADFNGDGKSDIAWSGDDGNALVWQMDGTRALQPGESSPPGNDVIDATAVGAGRTIHAIIGNGDDTYIGGAGADDVFVVSSQLDAQDVISGGPGGDDALLVTDRDAALTAAQLQQVTGFESLTLQAGGSATFTDALSDAGTFTANGTSTAADAFDGSAVTAYDIVFNGHGGADTLLGGPGDDRFNIPDSQFTAIAGGAGLDRIVLTTPGEHFDLHANAAKITDVEVISLLDAPGALLSLTGTDVAQINPDHTLYVLLGSDDEVSADSGWSLVSTTNSNAAVAPGVNFLHFEHTNGADLFIDDHLTLPVPVSAGAGFALVV